MNTIRLLLLTLLLTAIPIRGFSYTDDQVVEFGECYYKVVSGTKLTLSFIGTKASKTGPLNLPAKVTDKHGYVLTVIGAEQNTILNIEVVVLPLYNYLRPWNFSIVTSSQEHHLRP